MHSSCLPLVSLFFTVLTLSTFLGAIAWATWPAAVLFGLIDSLQFIVYGCHRIVLGFGGPCTARYATRAACASCLDVVQTRRVKCRLACLLRKSSALLYARGIRYDVDAISQSDGRTFSQFQQIFYTLCIICTLSRWRATIPWALILSLTCTTTKTSKGRLHTPNKS